MAGTMATESGGHPICQVNFWPRMTSGGQIRDNRVVEVTLLVAEHVLRGKVLFEFA